VVVAIEVVVVFAAEVETIELVVVAAVAGVCFTVVDVWIGLAVVVASTCRGARVVGENEDVVSTSGSVASGAVMATARVGSVVVETILLTSGATTVVVTGGVVAVVVEGVLTTTTFFFVTTVKDWLLAAVGAAAAFAGVFNPNAWIPVTETPATVIPASENTEDAAIAIAFCLSILTVFSHSFHYGACRLVFG
jgi:hypothetical protein